MPSNHGISTMAAMASRNTKAANRAKASVKAFRTAASRILKDAESSDAADADPTAMSAAIKRVKADASRVLADLHTYAEEITALNVRPLPRQLHRSPGIHRLIRLPAEGAQGPLGQARGGAVEVAAQRLCQSEWPKANPYRNRIKVNIQSNFILTSNSSGRTAVQQVEQETLPPSVPYMLESRILDERSHQIQQLRESVYGVHDLYLQIGDIVEYQGDQLDNIEMNMAHTFEDTMETNLALQATAASASGSRWFKFALGVILFCIVVIALTYRTLSARFSA
ncbi:syntaxin-3 isoform X1 [Babesia caballi]|uniref:Syntaxin-3 isoform X1 n=1 Tax=Babesia caballi TaxID=5871 RepID=A0AAV4LV72_BABCB|nr:syntaxin-3 isoform X1 [Babesia caballi]